MIATIPTKLRAEVKNGALLEPVVKALGKYSNAPMVIIGAINSMG
jgi:hypothetical protein